MFGRKTDAWWVRELERQARAHADERAAWDTERTGLLETICRLAEKPAYSNDGDEVPDEPESDTFDAYNAPDSIGHELVNGIEED